MKTLNKKYAVLFAGQGSQYIGMGEDFYHQYDYVRKLYNDASIILGYNLKNICFQENDFINKTEYTQPAVLITSIIIYEVLKKEFNLIPKVVLGFSLGEYSALYSSGVFTFSEIVEIIRNRAIDMELDSIKQPGKMAAILGLDVKILEDICKMYDHVQITNYNCPGQYVISGSFDSVDKVIEDALSKGARRAVGLNVSGAFHSPFMKDAALKMYQRIQKICYHEPLFDVIMNHTAKPLDINELPNLMKRQIESPVLFEKSITEIIENYQIDGFIEIGPGKVLSGFVKKINPEVKVMNIEKLSDLEKLNQEE